MKRQGWIIYKKQDAYENQSYIDWFINEAKKQGLSLHLILREELTISIINNMPVVNLHGGAVVLPDFAIIRTIEPLLSLYFEKCGVQTFNSAQVSHLCNHKSLTHLAMNSLNIPMVDTIFIQRGLLTSIPLLKFPFIVKESTGRSGKQVHFIQSNNDWAQCVQLLSTNDLVVQSANVQLGKDVRVFIIGKEIVGAVLRESKTDFRANYKLGGTASWYPLNDKEKDLIYKIIQHIDFDMVGIDFLIGLNGEFLFNEIEDVVGSRILSATSNVNILEKYVTHIKEKMGQIN